MKTPIAICYLLRDADAANRCLLFEDELQVIKDGREHVYSLQGQVGLEFAQKKWMLPLVGGSILFCLSLLFIFRALINPWFSLVLLIGSIFSIYLGWEGSPVLQIKSGMLRHVFPVRKISPNLKRFASFFHGYQLARKGHKNNLLIYHIASAASWEGQDVNDPYHHPSLESEGFIHFSHHDQVMGSYRRYFQEGDPLVLISIYPLDLKSPLKLEGAAPGADLFPHVYGPIDREAIVTVEPFQSAAQLTELLRRPSHPTS